ncbi:hypothetical protein C8Q74DRAFT_567182 [Fomes fomentarius]|nr:hypothetical protein C8Q74DRAFT_567182 [Fomes fomentarius]
MPILIDSAELAGLAIEGPLYGIFLSLFFICGYDLLRRRATNETQISWPMVVAGVLLILLATARFAVDVTYIFIAFIHNDPRSARLAFLQDVTPHIFTAKHALFITSLFIGDLFVNYRCWVVWGRNTWIVVLPVALSILAAGSGYYPLWAYLHLTDQSILAQQRALKLFFSTSLVANAMATSLLAFRIWWHERRGVGSLNLDGSEQKLTPIVRIVLESGLINAAFLFAYVMTVAFGSISLEILSEMGTPMCGIVFSIVIFRVGLRRRNRFRSSEGMPTLSWAPAAKSIGTRLGFRTSAAPEPRAPQRPVSTATAMRVIVHSSTMQKHDQFEPERRSLDCTYIV